MVREILFGMRARVERELHQVERKSEREKNHSGHRLEEKNRPTTDDRCRWRGIDSFLTSYFSSSFFHFSTLFFPHLFGEDFLFVRIETMVGGIFSTCS